MHAYGEFIRRIMDLPEFLRELAPKEPLFWKYSDEFRRMDETALLNGAAAQDSQQVALVRGAVWYALDELDAAHRIFQDEPSSIGSYWHGMMHRREGDFDNARYWFRRAGRLGLFAEMQEEARGVSGTMAKQPTWDPYLLTGLCEQVRHGDADLLEECRGLQRAEFRVLLGDAWGKAVG